MLAAAYGNRKQLLEVIAWNTKTEAEKKVWISDLDLLQH